MGRIRRCNRVLTLIFVAIAADAPKLTFKFTTIQLKGAQDTRVFGTNNAGVMVGAYVDSGGVDHGFMLKAGKVTTIDDPKGTNTNCLGINTAGDVVGWYVASSGAAQGFLRHGLKFTNIGPKGSTEFGGGQYQHRRKHYRIFRGHGRSHARIRLEWEEVHPTGCAEGDFDAGVGDQ